jgi:hypothetical protein
MVPGSLVSKFVCFARYVEEALRRIGFKSDGDQKDLVDFEEFLYEGCMCREYWR